jgi:glycosyltransferase involved in cell wall biosynthesis/Ser/Thr protein kinase RdoA (MazF antagonist)
MVRRVRSTGARDGRPLPDVSVVIPTRDRRDLLLEALRALATQTLATERYEVIPVVDGSADRTVEALAELETPYVLRPIVQPPKGRAGACNSGMRAAEGTIIVLLDDDMVPSPDFLAAHLRAHAAGDHLGVLGPVPIIPGMEGNAAERYVAKKFDRHLARLASGVPIGFRELYTGNFSARASDLRRVGLFDESFTVYGNEDGELGIRLLEAGVRLLYDPAALARQRFTKTFADLARDNEAKGRTAVMLSRKHPLAISQLKLSARPTRRLRLGRATLFSLTRVSSRLPEALVAGFGMLERVSPSLAEYLCPAILDYFYWRGARAEAHDADYSAEHVRPAEASRNALLRRADWRFLLPDPSPVMTVCYDPALRRAAALMSAHLMDPSDMPQDCNLAVLVDPDRRTLASAREALKPGGVCYVEWGPLKMIRSDVAARRLTQAGYGSVRCYWPWPRRGAAHVWLPLDSPSAIRYYLATRASRPYFPTRLAHAVGHAIAALAIRAGVAGTIVAVAQKPASHGEEGRIFDATAGSRQLLLTGGPRSISKAVSVVFAGPDPLPESIVKMNRTPEARAGIMREAEMLRYLERDRSSLTGVPRVVSVEDLTDITRVVETPLEGRPLHGELRRENLARNADMVTEWALGLAGLEPRASAEALWSELADPIVARFRRAYGPELDEREWQESQRILAALDDMPVVPEHRDLGPWNMLVDRGRLGVVDWESAVPRGLPALDLIYFILYAVGYATGVRRHRRLLDVYRAVRDVDTPFGALANDALRRYCGALGVDPGQLRALHLLTWMVHARSEHRRQIEDAGSRSLRHVADQSFFVGLWRMELATGQRA